MYPFYFMPILKRIEKQILKFHHAHKNSFLFGWIGRFFRSIYLHPRFRRTYLRFFALPEVWSVYKKIVGKEADRNILKEAMHSQALSLDFDKYHARDFTVLVLYVLVRALKPDVVIETGISSGRSSTAILDALDKNKKGTLYSFDLPKLNQTGVIGVVSVNENSYRQYIPKEVDEPGWLVPKELQSRWVKTLGDSNVDFPRIAKTLPKIDIFFHDSDHTYATMMNEYKTAWPKIQRGGLLLSDDVPSTEAFSEFSNEHKHSYKHIYNGLGIIVK